MTLKELWDVCPQSFLFVTEVHSTNKVSRVHGFEYTGGKQYADCNILNVRAASYPMYKSVLEVKIEA